MLAVRKELSCVAVLPPMCLVIMRQQDAHYWVQCVGKDGTWIQFDIDLPGTGYGHSAGCLNSFIVFYQ